MTEQSKLGERIRFLRKEKCLSIRTLASDAEIDHSYLSKIERGKRKPPSRRICLGLSRALELDVAGTNEVLDLASHSLLKREEVGQRDIPTGVSVAVLIEQDDKLLCVKQNAQKGGQISIPAGHLESGEMITDATMREILEETGLKIALLTFVGVYNRSQESGIRMGFAFTGCITGKDESARTGEIVEILWLSRDEVKDLISSSRLYRPEYSARVLTDWLAGESYPLGVIKEIR